MFCFFHCSVCSLLLQPSPDSMRSLPRHYQRCNHTSTTQLDKTPSNYHAHAQAHDPRNKAGKLRDPLKLVVEHGCDSPDHFAKTTTPRLGRPLTKLFSARNADHDEPEELGFWLLEAAASCRPEVAPDLGQVLLKTSDSQLNKIHCGNSTRDDFWHIPNRDESKSLD